MKSSSDEVPPISINWFCRTKRLKPKVYVGHMNIIFCSIIITVVIKIWHLD